MLGDKKKSYNIILEKKVKAKIHKLAEKDDRSDASYINKVLKDHLKEIGEWDEEDNS